MEIKELLDLGIRIILPYKENLDDYFGEVKAYTTNTGKYYITVINRELMDSEDILIFEKYDEFYEKLSSYFNNVGILIGKVMKENPDLEPEYSDDDYNKLKELVEKKQKELEKL